MGGKCEAQLFFGSVQITTHFGHTVGKKAQSQGEKIADAATLAKLPLYYSEFYDLWSGKESIVQSRYQIRHKFLKQGIFWRVWPL